MKLALALLIDITYNLNVAGWEVGQERIADSRVGIVTTTPSGRAVAISISQADPSDIAVGVGRGDGEPQWIDFEFITVANTGLIEAEYNQLWAAIGRAAAGHA